MALLALWTNPVLLARRGARASGAGAMALAKGMATSDQSHLGLGSRFLKTVFFDNPLSNSFYLLPAAVCVSFMPILPKASRTSRAEACDGRSTLPKRCYEPANTHHPPIPPINLHYPAHALGSGLGAQLPSGCFATGPLSLAFQQKEHVSQMKRNSLWTRCLLRASERHSGLPGSSRSDQS